MEWFRNGLFAVACFGISLGSLSLLFPARSIRLYQWIMERFNWRVEPIHYGKEIRNTRILGGWMVLLSLLMGLALFRPEWFLLSG